MLIKFFRNLFVFFLLLSVSLYSKAQSTKSILLKNVDSIPVPPAPQLNAFFVVINDAPQIIAMQQPEQNAKTAALLTSVLGKGKVVFLSSTAYLKTGMLADKNVANLLVNILNWAKPANGAMLVALAGNMEKGFNDLLKQQNAISYITNDFVLKKRTDLLVLNKDVIDTVQLKRIEQFVVNGGTLFFTSPYPDLYNSPEATADLSNRGLSVNKLLAKAGAINPNVLVTRSPDNTVLKTDSVPDYLYVRPLFGKVLGQNQLEPNSSLFFLVNYYIDMILKYNKPGVPVINYIKNVLNAPNEMPVPSVANPVPNQTPLLKAKNKFGYWLYTNQQDFDHHPEARAAGYKIFPGDVPATAPRVKEAVNIPVKAGTQGLSDMPSIYYRPHSTGLYLPAGEKVKVIIQSADIKQHFKAQVGVHNDDITGLDEIRRIPLNLTKTFELDKDTTEVYSPYGGLLLINIGDTTKQKTVSIKVEGAVKAPYFKLGETSDQDWNNTIRNNPAPWAELATDNIVFTVPSYRIRYLSSPVKLMQFWDEVMDADADLADISRKRVHQERVIVDIDAAYGSMFTVPYKIVAPDDENCGKMLDEAFMRSTGLWGHFHELGHRHQFFDLDFPGTTEVTVNLYTMYIFDKVLHKGLYNHEDMSNMAEVLQKIKTYLADNPSYDKWSNDPFLALSMYIQIIDKFGWDAIKKANVIYRNLPKSQYPKTDQDKRDLWFTTICKTTNSNLTHFFDVWKIPVSDTAKKQVVAFKPWFPEELKGY